MAKEIRYPELQNLANNPIVQEDLYDGYVKPTIKNFKTIAGMVNNILKALKRGEDVHDMAIEVDQKNVAIQKYIEYLIDELEGGLHEDVQILLCGALEELGHDKLIEKVENGSVIQTICKLKIMSGCLNGLRERVADGVMLRIQQEDEEKGQEHAVEIQAIPQKVAGDSSDMDLD